MLRACSAALVTATLVLPASSLGYCPRFGSPVCVAPGDQSRLSAVGYTGDSWCLGVPSTPVALMRVVWQDERDAPINGSDVYFGEVHACMDSSSRTGSPVSNDLGNQSRPAEAISGLPSCYYGPTFASIVAWQDDRGLDSDIYAHRLPIFSAPSHWDSAGVRICGAPGDQTEPALVGNSRGGAVIGWVDRRSGSADIYAQRVDSAGVAVWDTNGIPICAAPGDQTDLGVTDDGEDGAMFCWLDRRSGYAIYAARVTADGTLAPGWMTDGNPVVTSASNIADLRFTADGAGGLLAAWSDFRTDSNGDVYGQRLGGSGAPAPGWPLNGVPVSAGVGPQRAAEITPVGAGGTFVVWEGEGPTHAQTLASSSDIFAQRLTPSGEVQPGWPAEGVAVCNDPADQEHARAITWMTYTYGATADSGLIVTWVDHRDPTNGPDIYALRLRGNGTITPGLWIPNGVLVCGAPDVQDFPVIVPGVSFLLAWVDYRNRSENGADVYASNVAVNGAVDVARVPDRPLTLGSPRPNPAHRLVTLSLELPEDATLTARVIDISGRRVRTLTTGPQARGRHDLTWDGRDDSGHAVRAGLYFVKVDTQENSQARRVILLP